jgi:prepilin-type N-terminal cleavage/methylation domain-containing protein
MKQDEKGFTLLELIITIAIMVLVSGAALAGIFQISKTTELNANYMTAVFQVQNAGYWIAHDTRMAQGLTTDNLTLPDFLILSWIEQGSCDKYQLTYTLENMAGSQLAKMLRNQYMNGVLITTTLVAQYIDPDNGNTRCEYDSGILSLNITATVDRGSSAEIETRSYNIVPRPNSY